jgi:transcriptional regulator with XRE-family HTH domain
MTEETPKTTAMPLAERVKQLRRQHSLTQEDLACRAGLGVTTIQRVERGEQTSSATIASIAAAFDISTGALISASVPRAIACDDSSFLPLAAITSGKQFVDLILQADALDFDYSEINDAALAELVDRLYRYCLPDDVPDVLDNPAERIRKDMEASKLLKELAAAGLAVSGAAYERTCAEVDDIDGGAIPILLARWDETCLVIRVGADGLVVDRADVEARMEKWTESRDPRIVRPQQSIE